MVRYNEVKPSIERFLLTFSNSTNLKNMAKRDLEITLDKITVEELETLAKHPLFDDICLVARINLREKEKLKLYLIDTSAEYRFVEELHEYLPKYFRDERDEYVRTINNYRSYRGLHNLFSKKDDKKKYKFAPEYFEDSQT